MAASDAQLHALDVALIEAHAAGDRARLAALYGEAGQRFETAGELDRACFFYTHAYVYALEIGDRAATKTLLRTLRRHGREAPAGDGMDTPETIR